MINVMEPYDIDALAETFRDWLRRRELYERYWQEQLRDERVVFVAREREAVVGYTTLVWQSGYVHFRALRIPEIVDLNVVDLYQHRGVGTALIHDAEQYALLYGKRIIGISVVQSEEYAAANRLYPYLGYRPDGYGITPYDQELHLIKHLS
jgi:GNAT superfamily N-acetyltransferase